MAAPVVVIVLVTVCGDFVKVCVVVVWPMVDVCGRVVVLGEVSWPPAEHEPKCCTERTIMGTWWM